MRTVLVTGAAGGIGTRLRKLLKGVYPRIRWSDIRPPSDLSSDETFVPADLADLAQVEDAVAGVDGIEPGWMILDVGPRTCAVYAERLSGAGTVVWNGPVGVFEIPEFSEGTRALGEAIADSGAYSLVGGGDTAAAVEQMGLQGRFSHVSTGGGATLEYMEGRELPGVAVLKEAS